MIALQAFLYRRIPPYKESKSRPCSGRPLGAIFGDHPQLDRISGLCCLRSRRRCLPCRLRRSVDHTVSGFDVVSVTANIRTNTFSFGRLIPVDLR